MFATANGRKDGLASQCRKCRARRDDKRIAHGRQRDINAKLERGFCEVTGTPVTLDNLYLFEWDHRDPSQKKYVVGRMRVKKDILYFAEIAKCRLILRSVHIEHTRRQRADGLFNNNARTNNPESVISRPPEQLSMFEEPAQ
jgi:hypothetical protein